MQIEEQTYYFWKSYSQGIEHSKYKVRLQLDRIEKPFDPPHFSKALSCTLVASSNHLPRKIQGT